MRVGGWGLGCGVVLLGLGAAGCGNSSSSGPSGASGNAAVAGASGNSAGSGGTSNVAGSSSNGGSSGSAAGAGSGGLSSLNLGNSLTEACMAYVLAVCMREAECSGASASNSFPFCLTRTLGCPDLTASPGSTRTVEGLHACAKTYQTLSCEQIKAEELPPCVTPGTVPLGGACAFNSQCASLTCGGGNEGCGVCIPTVEEGGACSQTDGECVGNLVCEGGKCRKPGTSPTGAELKDVGGTCAARSDCKPELLCQNGSCAEYPMLGQSCSETRTCKLDSYCEVDGLTCKAYPGLGQACGVDGFTGEAAYCADGLSCARTSKAVGACGPLPSLGQPCLIDPETAQPEYLACAIGTRCDATLGPPSCVALSSKGQACLNSSQCATGLQCLCPDGTSTCDTHVCAELRFRDQACGAAGEVCHLGFSCTAGKCQPRDSQGLFQDQCAGAP